MTASQVSRTEVNPVAVKPRPNEIQFQGRPITTAEIQASQAFFEKQSRQLAGQLVEQFEERFPDPAKLVSELNVKGVDSDIQTRISQAIEKGDASQLQILWATATRDIARAEELHQQVTLQKTVTDLREKASAGSLKAGELLASRRALGNLDLPQEKKAAVAGIFDSLENHLKISEVISNAVPGQAGNLVDLPNGVVPVIWNPKLPARTAVALGNGMVMVGTGGAGYVQMSTASVAEAMGLPVGSGDPLSVSTDTPIVNGVLLVNPESTRTPVSYRVQQTEFTLLPGNSQHLPAGSARSIEVSRGGRSGAQRHELSPGTYHFAMTAEGWKLQVQEVQVVVDNSDNPRDFHYVAQNEATTVSARQTRTHTSKYPIVIRYDRGNGQFVKQVQVDHGTVKVAINADDGLWDLFLLQQMPAEEFVPSF